MKLIVLFCVIAASSTLMASTKCDNSEYITNTPYKSRWANDNPKGSSCYDAVQNVRKLGNDPEYDCNASTRREWSQAVDFATSLGCTL